ncbi:flavonol sulfotransferase-like [Euphorbia lathyris]|uniref:flavonol sulfotransferase-like n=1 Tax=Euphorbia lathyris TaxID=212925 RepID=UPI00331337B6
MDLIPPQHTEFISTLPTRNDWKFMSLHKYQGFWYFSPYLSGVLTTQNTFKAQPSDIFLCTSPKTGTTWLKALAFAILTRSQFDLSSTPLLTSTPHDCVPFLEIDAYAAENNRNSQSPLVATHIPYTSLPDSIIESKCKIVYICRDPKDVLISMWHFFRAMFPAVIDKDEYVNIDDCFKSFCEGASHIGPYWDHVLGYWNASLEFPDRVLFLVYEDVKKDTVSVVKRLAEFMGCGFSPEEEKQGLVQKIVDFCSFENLRGLKVSQSGGSSEKSPFTVQNSSFYRKAKTGDWSNYITQEMGDLLDKIVEQKMSGSGFSFLKSSK